MIKHKYWFFSLLFLAQGALLSGCQSVQGVYDAAETDLQKVFALYGTFVIIEEQAAEVMIDQRVPNEVKFKIQEADARLKPLADQGLILGLEYATAREAYENALAEGQEEGLSNVLINLQFVAENLDRWMTQFEPLLNDFISTVKGD